MPAPQNNRAGFTLLELLLALSIFTLVTTMSAVAFWSVLKSWNRGNEMLEQLHYGEFAMNQLVTALRGAAWFSSKPQAFGFWLDDRGGTSETAANEISWVTSGTAFLPPDSPFQHGLHRLSVTVDGSGEERGLAVRAWPHLAEEEDGRDAEEWRVAPGVEGFACEWYDFDEDGWSQDWEETNSLPKLLRVTLTMREREDFEENLVLQRLVVLEVAPALPGRENRDRTTEDPARAAERDEAAGRTGEEAQGEDAPEDRSNSSSGNDNEPQVEFDGDDEGDDR